MIRLIRNWLPLIEVQEISPPPPPLSSGSTLSNLSSAPSTPWYDNLSEDRKENVEFTQGIDLPWFSMASPYPFDVQQLASPSAPQLPPLPYEYLRDRKTNAEVIEGTNLPSFSMATLYPFDAQQLGPPSVPSTSLPYVHHPHLPNAIRPSTQKSEDQIHCPALQAHALQYFKRLEMITGHGVISDVKSSPLSKKASEKRRTRTKFALCPVEGCGSSFTRTHNINGENSFTVSGDHLQLILVRRLCLGHLNNHFGYMPYVCDEEDCDYRSSYSFSIDRHKKQAHGHPAQV